MVRILKHLIQKLYPNRVYFSYRGFYDFPEAMVVEIRGRGLFFIRYFDEKLDDYDLSYTVYQLDQGTTELEPSLMWDRTKDLSKKPLCEIPISQIQFDRTRRVWMESSLWGNIPVTPVPAQSD